MTPDERRERILDLALTHGVVTAEWVYPEHYPGLTAHSADKDLQLLRDGGLLRRFRDSDLRAYYTPTEKLCALRGMSRSFGRAGGATSVARRVGVAWYCLRYGLDRHSARRFKADFPELAKGPGACGHYYVDRSEEPHQVGWVEVDCNTRGDLRRTVRRVAKLFRVRRKHPAWLALIDAGQFHVVVVTPSEAKQEALKRAVARSKHRLEHVFVEVVGELQPILLQETPKWSPRSLHPGRPPAPTSKPSSTAPPPTATGTPASGDGGGPSSGSPSDS